MATIKDIISKIDGASAAFDGVITKTEKKLFDSVVGQVKLLDIDGMGHIKTTTSNLKLLSDISVKLQQMTSKDKEYLSGVKSLAKAFDDIYKAQAAFYAVHFAEKTLNDKAKAKYEAMKRVAVTNTVSGLTGAGLQSYVLNPLSKTLLRAVTSGSKYSDLVLELRRQLTSADKEHQSALAKYAKTYATTALTQYAGQNNKLFTDDLKTEWFEYVGSEIETTREFCHHLTNKRYIHVSELPSILDGKIEYDGTVHHCKMNPKTGLPAGLIEGTTPDNFQVNVGGWNCRHQLVPVAKEAVPKDIRAKFDSHTAEEIAKQKAEEEKKKKVAEARAAMERVSGFKDYDSAPMQKAIESGDVARLNELIEQADKLYERFDDILLFDAYKFAKEFSFDDLRVAEKKVFDRMSRMPEDLKSRKKDLEFEIKWVEEHKKYATWKVAKEAYERELSRVSNVLELETIRKAASDVMYFASVSSSKLVKRYASELNNLLSSDTVDIKAAKAKLEQLQAKVNEIRSAGLKTATSDEPQKCTPKTLEQLKEELGEQLPRTLSNLGNRIAEYEQTRDYGAETRKYKATIEREMRKIFNEHDFGMNIDDDLLETVLDSWFKNQFEVGGGHGAVYERGITTGKIGRDNGRLRLAHKMWGLGSNYDADQLPRREYEKYGSLLDHDILASLHSNPARGYGNVEVRFKKSKVIATWIPEDTLNTGGHYQPSLCSDPKACSFDNSSRLPKGETSTKSFTEWRRKHVGWAYMELQYHGNLTPDCVESITFPYDITTSSYYNVALRWKKAGAKIYYRKDGKLYRL